ncbi:MAG: hypothetical protein H0U86_11140 [Chloroflexi bacterium]|nr:hypothetical protein [Chloroflexota bacterium]
MMPERFENELRDWLAQRAPSEAPDSILDAVSERIEDLAPQARRSFLASVLAAAAVILLAFTAGVGIAGLMSPERGPEIGVSDPPEPIELRCPADPCEVPLAANAAYRASRFALDLTVSVPSTRWVLATDLPGFFRVEIRTDQRRGISIFTDPTPVDPLGNRESRVAQTPAALVEWLRRRPELAVSAPDEVVIGGLSGLAVDLRGDPRATTRSDGCAEEGGLCSAVFRYSAGGGDERTYGSSTLDRIRLYLLDAGGTVVVVAVEARHQAPAASFEAEASGVLDGLVIRERSE